MIRRRSKHPTLASGERIYAIGDIHGRLDLFASLVRRIKVDAARRPARRTKVVLIGDMIDRGPNSAQLIEQVQQFCYRTSDIIVLRGNHEQMMVHSLRGDINSLQAWLRFGGDATLKSWGLSDQELSQPPEIVLATALQRVPSPTIAWLAGLRLSYRSGDFFFTHAGIRPGVPLVDQDADDLLWIGTDFLSDLREHPAVIVTGTPLMNAALRFSTIA